MTGEAGFVEDQGERQAHVALADDADGGLAGADAIEQVGHKDECLQVRSVRLTNILWAAVPPIGETAFPGRYRECMIRPWRDDDAAGWDAFVSRHPAARCCHLSAWKRIIERAFGHPTCYLVSEGEDRRVDGVLSDGPPSKPPVWRLPRLGAVSQLRRTMRGERRRVSRTDGGRFRDGGRPWGQAPGNTDGDGNRLRPADQEREGVDAAGSPRVARHSLEAASARSCAAR